MGDPLRDLEERLERLAPRGLSEQGRTRLDEQIDALSAEVGETPRTGGRWRVVVGIAAAAAALAGVFFFSENGGSGRGAGNASLTEREDPFSKPGVAVPASFETVDFERTVGDGEDDGIVLDRFDEPYRSWSYPVREMELVLDPKTGMRVRILQERREQIRVAVTSF